MKQQSLFPEDLSLGPKSNYTVYQTYIDSPEWKKKRERAFKLLGRKCQKCGRTKSLQVHHLHYETLFNESASDVEIVCTVCHPLADDQRATEKGFNTWLVKRHGEWADHYRDEGEYDKFMDFKYREPF